MHALVSPLLQEANISCSTPRTGPWSPRRRPSSERCALDQRCGSGPTTKAGDRGKRKERGTDTVSRWSAGPRRTYEGVRQLIGGDDQHGRVLRISLPSWTEMDEQDLPRRTAAEATNSTLCGRSAFRSRPSRSRSSLHVRSWARSLCPTRTAHRNGENDDRALPARISTSSTVRPLDERLGKANSCEFPMRTRRSSWQWLLAWHIVITALEAPPLAAG